jgi:leucyl/phenylalanyl-tRNA--protein transferase
MARAASLCWIEPGAPLPDPEQALDDPAGLLAAGLDLGPERLLEAYSRGIFPWFSEGQPVLWWSPDPRMVLQTDRFKASRSLRQTVRRRAGTGRWTVRLDTAFEAVMRACAAPRRTGTGTWISEPMVAAYGSLHRMGWAHSVEIWDDAEQLIGGLYGVAIGRMFFGESMFARETDASKVALFALVRTLQALNFPMIDCQQSTSHLASLGAGEIKRAEFLRTLAGLVQQPGPDWGTVRIEIDQA